MERKPISKVQHAALQRRVDAMFDYASKLGVNLRLKFIYPKDVLAKKKTRRR